MPPRLRICICRARCSVRGGGEKQFRAILLYQLPVLHLPVPARASAGPFNICVGRFPSGYSQCLWLLGDYTYHKKAVM